MSLECGYCERDLREGHAPDCKRPRRERSATFRAPMASCGGCRRRRRCVALWYLPRKGVPVRHVGLPVGWTIVRGLTLCHPCQVRLQRVDAERRSVAP